MSFSLRLPKIRQEFWIKKAEWFQSSKSKISSWLQKRDHEERSYLQLNIYSTALHQPDLGYDRSQLAAYFFAFCSCSCLGFECLADSAGHLNGTVLSWTNFLACSSCCQCTDSDFPSSAYSLHSFSSHFLYRDESCPDLLAILAGLYRCTCCFEESQKLSIGRDRPWPFLKLNLQSGMCDWQCRM